MDRRSRKVRIPIGIEKVLCAAAADHEFRDQLIVDRVGALGGTVFQLTAAEASILRSVSDDALRTMIENIDLRRHKRRKFFRGIAAASLVATAAMGMVECSDADVATKGIAPGTYDVEEHLADAGGTNTALDVLDVLEKADSLGNTGDTPDEVEPEDVDEVDVDAVQMRAGIPPMDIKEDLE